MLPALVTLSLFVTSAVCVPVLAPQGNPVTNLAPIVKREGITYIEYVSNNPDDPNSWKPVRTFTKDIPGPTAAPVTPQKSAAVDSKKETANTTPASGSSSTGSDNNDLLAVINKWRSAYGKKLLTWDQGMLDAATNTGNLNGGGANGMNHHAPKNAAEVIAPGSDHATDTDLQGHSPFEISYLAWLCEVRDKELGDLCDFQQSIMKITNTGRGHHDILLSDSYSKIGCAYTARPNPEHWFLSQGQWTCDLTW